MCNTLNDLYAADDILIKFKDVIDKRIPDKFSDHIKKSVVPKDTTGIILQLLNENDFILNYYNNVILQKYSRKYIFYNRIRLNPAKVKKIKWNFKYLQFINDRELVNFCNYIKTDFFKIHLYIYRNNKTLYGILKNIPWLPVYDAIFSDTPEKIDEFLFKKFNIPEECVECIRKTVSEYFKR